MAAHRIQQTASANRGAWQQALYYGPALLMFFIVLHLWAVIKTDGKVITMKHFLLILIVCSPDSPGICVDHNHTRASRRLRFGRSISIARQIPRHFELTQSNGNCNVTGVVVVPVVTYRHTANTAIGSDSASFGSVLPLTP